MSSSKSMSFKFSEPGIQSSTEADLYIPESGARDNYTSEEHVVKETKTRSVPTYVDMPPRLDPMVCPPSVEPVTVRWDYVTPDSISPERKLQRLDQEMQRLAREMNQLSGHSSSSLQADPNRLLAHSDASRLLTQSDPNRLLMQSSTPYRPPPLMYQDSDFNRLWSQLDREADMKRLWGQAERDAEMTRLWNEATRYRGHPSYPTLMPCFEPPRGFVKLSPGSSQSLLPRAVDTLWGADTHPESWRRKENFHIENPVVKSSDGRSQFRLEFDLRQFRPDEIEVLTDGHLLTVQAKHEDNEQGKKVRREYFRQCTIPDDVDPRSVISQLSQSGILSVHAPLPRAVEESCRSIHIKQK